MFGLKVHLTLANTYILFQYNGTDVPLLFIYSVKFGTRVNYSKNFRKESWDRTSALDTRIYPSKSLGQCRFQSLSIKPSRGGGARGAVAPPPPKVCLACTIGQCKFYLSILAYTVSVYIHKY